MTVPARGGSSVDLRRAFRLDASSVWVVTSADAGTPVGFTAVSVVSVSLAPPILSFNVSRTSSSLDTLLRSGRYAVHLLAADQEATARRFAGPAAERFADDRTWSWDEDGLPRLHGVLTRLSGSLLRLVDAGDSHLVLGEVARSDADDDRRGLDGHDGLDGLDLPARLPRRTTDPLLHHDRTYTRAERPAPVQADRTPQGGSRPGARHRPPAALAGAVA
ncbi:flavin reductase family protein [Aquipuribacter hungaricus]|uniref:Flavin reductase family protein n=2 Tax=Aquipuribacter hungaricus TaxID=545624 RepID=A0ABV7WJE8_9MICO